MIIKWKLPPPNTGSGGVGEGCRPRFGGSDGRVGVTVDRRCPGLPFRPIVFAGSNRKFTTSPVHPPRSRSHLPCYGSWHSCRSMSHGENCDRCPASWVLSLNIRLKLSGASTLALSSEPFRQSDGDAPGRRPWLTVDSPEDRLPNEA
jgi:hypothetical protein